MGGWESITGVSVRCAVVVVVSIVVALVRRGGGFFVSHSYSVNIYRLEGCVSGGRSQGCVSIGGGGSKRCA